jgi:abnormal spindle-like microcephaly-associated protein
VLVQTLWRGRVCLSRYQKFRTAATILQAAFRKLLAWHEHSRRQGAVAKIQRSWRRFTAFVRFCLIVNDVIAIQSIVRRNIARRQKQGRNRAVRTLQQACRRFVAVQLLSQLRVDREQERSTHFAATLLQSWCRGFLGRRALFKFHCYATLVQTAFRRHCTRMDYRMKLVDIVIVQRETRRWLAGRVEKRKVQATTMVQSHVRKWLSSSRFQKILSTKKTFDLTVGACTRIQRLWRGHVARNLARRHSAARAIQKTWRSFDVHVDYILKVMDVITIQSFFRCFIVRTRFKKARHATMLMQALARRKAQSNKLANMTRSGVIIQSAIRASLAKSELQRCRQASVAIQRYTRGFLVRDERAIANFAASYIQRVWRGQSKYKDYVSVLLSVKKIQSIVRISVAKSMFRNLKLAMWSERAFRFRKAVCLQRAFRQYALRLRYLQAASTLQRVCRGFLVQKRRQRFRNGVHRLQALARARLLRRRLPPRVVRAARRVYRAHARAKDDPKMLLGYRASEALSVLQTSTRLFELMAAVATLETSTRLSFVCCKIFTNSQAAKSLLALIRTCNRSLPHMELLQHILLTLNNISKHPTLLPSFANPESAEVFLDLSQIFRDKDGIFCLSVSLLGCVFGCDDRVKVSK